jgi:PhnB protein
MAKTIQPIPPGFRSITPHLTVDGCAKYLDFLKTAFSAEEVFRAPGPGGKIMHATMKIGDSLIMLNDHFPELGFPPIPKGPWPIALHLYVTDVDAAFDRAVKNGCTVKMPLADQFWGDRYGTIEDPFGYTWGLATTVENPTPEEVAERQQKMFGGGAS